MGKMELYLKITAGLLLLFQAFHLASLQHSTDSPGRTIDGGWLRDLAKGKTGSQNTAVPGKESEYYQKADATTVESNSDYSGIASGSMVMYKEEEESVTGRDDDAREESDDPNVATTNTVPSTVLNVTTEQPELPDIKVSPTTATTDSTNSSEANMTDAEEALNNSTATPQNSTTELRIQNSTSLLDYFNHTDSQTTLAPEGNATQESMTKPAEDTRLTTTESTNSTTLAPEIAETSATSSSTTFLPSTSTEIGPDATTNAAQNTPEANKTGKGSATGSSSERGTANPFSCVTSSGSRNLLCVISLFDRYWKIFDLCVKSQLADWC